MSKTSTYKHPKWKSAYPNGLPAIPAGWTEVGLRRWRAGEFVLSSQGEVSFQQSKQSGTFPYIIVSPSWLVDENAKLVRMCKRLLIHVFTTERDRRKQGLILTIDRKHGLRLIADADKLLRKIATT